MINMRVCQKFYNILVCGAYIMTEAVKIVEGCHCGW